MPGRRHLHLSFAAFQWYSRLGRILLSSKIECRRGKQFADQRTNGTSRNAPSTKEPCQLPLPLNRLTKKPTIWRPAIAKSVDTIFASTGDWCGFHCSVPLLWHLWSIPLDSDEKADLAARSNESKCVVSITWGLLLVMVLLAADGYCWCCCCSWCCSYCYSCCFFPYFQCLRPLVQCQSFQMWHTANRPSQWLWVSSSAFFWYQFIVTLPLQYAAHSVGRAPEKESKKPHCCWTMPPPMEEANQSDAIKLRLRVTYAAYIRHSMHCISHTRAAHSLDNKAVLSSYICIFVACAVHAENLSQSGGFSAETIV